ncbi:winged helix-turn-helix transcriptional regulator [Mucilaginibacter sp. AW1-7]|jgi:DNA-binding HxlR family transcriptional regulator|uniref:winged helix-turn-helix transcriptional regulator n=1 Tax=unclassified Mucilaginibacter TaxID=2617802 RepID=UPI0008D2CD35|nr:helix-turn-helix domain-containing protein [Mucilaginibacter sp. OK283]SEO59104.1 transcriptional regulator, HxlR family [Mucilaginibacter sp. OK283]
MKDERFCNSNCPFTRAIGTIGNKWKPIIINVIGTRTIRFGQLDSIIPLISRKVLTEQLKELEEDGLLERLAYKELPPRVEYKLSEKGLAFLPILEHIKEWNLKYEVALIPKETDRVTYAG